MLAIVGCIVAFYAIKYTVWGASLVIGWICGIIGGAFKGAFSLGFSTVTSLVWVSTVVQVVGTVVLSLCALSITIRFSFGTVRKMTVQFIDFKKDHPEAVEQLKKKTPPLIASIGIIAQMASIFASEVLPSSTTSDKIFLVTFGALLLIPSWASSILLEQKSKFRRVIGWLFWLLSILSIPGVIWIAAKGDLAKVTDILSSHPEIIGFTAIVILLAIITPRIVRSEEEESDAKPQATSPAPPDP